MFDHPKVAILVSKKVDDETGVGECKQCFIFPEKKLKSPRNSIFESRVPIITLFRYAV